MRCRTCQRENRSGDRFCAACGARLDAAAPPVRDPRAHTPPHLARTILALRGAIEGERKQVTVLFADVKDSLELAEQLDPEAWHVLLDRFFAILGAGIARYGGIINQFTGDGVMALFGAPIAHEDHAQRACHAALDLARELRSFAHEVHASHAVPFAVRIGINSGEVVVGTIGDDLRMDYTAQGHTVGLASRLEQLAAPGEVLVGDRTAALVAGFFQLEDAGLRQVKGVRDPVHVYVLRDRGALRTRLDLSRERGLTSFVGRGDEMAILDRALRRALDGHGGALGVVGAAGVGKSRLCEEFVARCRARDVGVIEAHCLSHARTAPLSVLRDLLRSALGIDGAQAPEHARARIAEGLASLDAALDDAVPLVNDLLAVGDAGPMTAPGPAADERAVALFLRRLLRARAARGPLVVHLDDAHWIDPVSERLLAEVAEVASTMCALLLLNFRPEFHGEWMGRSYYQQLPVSPLGRAPTDEMLAGLLGDDPSVARLADLIHAHTEGNPFFIEEVIRALVAWRALVGERGAYTWLQPSSGLEVPATVQALLAARIDALAEQEKLVLQAAAVIGKRFSERVLRRIVRIEGGAVDAALVALTRAEFVHGDGDAEHAFRHPLTQEVAYASQLSAQRELLHGEVATALEDVLAERLGECAAVIAHHWEQARKPTQAARWRRLAALRVTRIQPRRSPRC